MAKAKLPALLTATTATHVTDGIYAGIDQSLTGTGVVVLAPNGEPLGHELFCTSAGARPMDEINRFVDLFQRVHAYISGMAGGRPVCALLEDFAFAQPHQMAQLGGLGWHFRIMMSRTPWYFGAANPSLVKKMAVGVGNAKKEQVMLGVYKRWGFEAPDNNVADAYVLAKLCWTLYGKPFPGVGGVRKDDVEAASKVTIYR